MRLDHLKHVRSYWNEEAARYAVDHPEHFDTGQHPSWGLFNISEDELRIVIDDLPSSARLLDLGCGRGQDAVGYAMRGVDVVGIDVSDEQLAGAIPHEGVRYLHAAAEATGLEDAGFDAVVSDHGAFDHSPPGLLLPEVSRLLRVGGVLAVCTYTPLALSCYAGPHRPLGRELSRPYPVDRVAFDGRVTSVEYSYAGWIDEFRAAGFEVLRLAELRPPADAKPYFSDLVTAEWANQWPCELIWKVRKGLS